MNIKKILSIFICLAALLSLNSCEDDGPRGGGGVSKQYVFTPYSIMVDILDEQGRSRLSPQHPQNLLDKNITATIRDKTYTFRIVDPYVDYDPTYQPGGEPYSRYTNADIENGNPIPAVFYGLYLSKSDANPIYKQELDKTTSHPYLAMGQFHGEGTYEETIVFNIPGYPQPIKVEFARELTWTDEAPYYKGYTRVNGVEQKTGTVTITLPSWE